MTKSNRILLYMIVIALLIVLVSQIDAVFKDPVTKRVNKLLLRKRRYLTFPMGSNLIMTLSLIKSLMIKAPAGLRLSAECDVPFSLPSDTRPFRGYKTNHQRQRREIFAQMSDAIDSIGHNGTACIKRAVCDFRVYMHLKSTSLVQELLMTIFKFDEPDEYFRQCDANLHRACKLPLFNYFEGLSSLEMDG